jgi:hypothetical protein
MRVAVDTSILGFEGDFHGNVGNPGFGCLFPSFNKPQGVVEQSRVLLSMKVYRVGRTAHPYGTKTFPYKQFPQMAAPIWLEDGNALKFHTFCGLTETERSHWNSLDPQQDMPAFIVLPILFDCDRYLLFFDEHLFPDRNTVQQHLHGEWLVLLFNGNHRDMAFFLHHAP